MSLSIGSASEGILRAMYQTQNRIDRTFTRLASGKLGATDDAAGLAISKRFEAQVRSLGQGENNLANGASYASTAEGTLQSSHDALSRMRELSVQAQNGTLNEGDRAIIQEEYNQLAEQLTQTAPQAGSTTITDGNGGEIEVEVGDTSAAGLGVAGLSVSDPGALAAIDGAINQISSTRSSLGTAVNTIAHRSEIVGAMREGFEQARSRIEDADFAKEMADLTRDRILQNLQLSGLTKQDRSQQTALDLLG